mmetsp:Transcript_11981/g.16249  ORF Transcript_11981/g.16249 Transcript_11981/m.16249 type:complete len:159 (+) Transcript_11981:133-609(+)|eukprot:CAMPEP_0196575398 /NCGR_PEP_ID=MMETSP1081-20130531/4888_1 /TAXON_ID=36882 /ORGANISM="Pyramimonas amylifera, Strain CCMP720" /LENGTH=158 /DNA_ID=CAMNT_0041893689 /DNA_START=133 /DNA_END=609 /DNA_ORIENTATION=+
MSSLYLLRSLTTAVSKNVCQNRKLKTTSKLHFKSNTTVKKLNNGHYYLSSGSSHQRNFNRLGATKDSEIDESSSSSEVERSEIDLTAAADFMIREETEFLDKVAENSAVRETLKALEIAREAEEEVLTEAWDLLVKLGAKRPEDGPGSEKWKKEEEKP